MRLLSLYSFACKQRSPIRTRSSFDRVSASGPRHCSKDAATHVSTAIEGRVTPLPTSIGGLRGLPALRMRPGFKQQTCTSPLALAARSRRADSVRPYNQVNHLEHQNLYHTRRRQYCGSQGGDTDGSLSAPWPL